MNRPTALTIAGSDSGGGAGIQADLKTFTALGVYGSSAITALTAQNTMGVQGISEVDPSFVAAQIDAVLGDIGADAVKTGMLMSAAIVEVVADAIERHPVPHLVVDPVMVAKSGDRLLLPHAVEALKTRLMPLATILTPNTEEAAILAGLDSIDNERTMRLVAEKLVGLGPNAVLVKGGHLGGATSNDLWYDGEQFTVLPSTRHDNRHTHGTGCTLSAALAAFLARGLAPLDAAHEAKRYITGAIAAAYPIGNGIGPVDHLWEQRDL